MKSFALLIFLFLSLLTFLNARNDESAGQTGNPFQKDEVDKRIDKAIGFIISKQKKDGSIYDRGNHTTMTSLALMAMAAVGHQPVNPNDEGEAMQRALDFVLQEDRQSETGYYGSKDGSRMYGHGITTHAFRNAWHGSGRRTGSENPQKNSEGDRFDFAFAKGSKSPSHQGGWRYSPDSRDADLSATIWQLMSSALGQECRSERSIRRH